MATTNYTGTWRVTVSRQKEVEVEENGHKYHKYEPLPDEMHNVEMTIDLARIAAWLGNRAAHNKNGLCKFMDGLVIVKDLGKVAQGR